MIPMLLMAIFQHINGLEHKPPITIGLLAINIWLYISPETIPIDLDPRRICLAPAKMIRLLFAPSFMGNASRSNGR